MPYVAEATGSLAAWWVEIQLYAALPWTWGPSCSYIWDQARGQRPQCRTCHHLILGVFHSASRPQDSGTVPWNGQCCLVCEQSAGELSPGHCGQARRDPAQHLTWATCRAGAVLVVLQGAGKWVDYLMQGMDSGPQWQGPAGLVEMAVEPEAPAQSPPSVSRGSAVVLPLSGCVRCPLGSVVHGAGRPCCCGDCGPRPAHAEEPLEHR